MNRRIRRRPDFDNYAEMWRAVLPLGRRRALGRQTGMTQKELIQAHLEVYFALPGSDYDDQLVQYQGWVVYLDAFVKGGYTREERFRAFGELATDPRDFDWTNWRLAMGYDHPG